MNKKSKRRRQQKKFPWPLVVGGGILVIVATFFVFSNGSGSSSGTSAITVDQPAIDYGYVQFGNNKSFAIKVTNTGDGTLRFKDKPYIEVLEGCWPPELTIGTMALNPGESTTVQSSVFMMHPGMDGPHDYAVHLKTNDPTNSDLVVHVKSNWGP